MSWLKKNPGAVLTILGWVAAAGMSVVSVRIAKAVDPVKERVITLEASVPYIVKGIDDIKAEQVRQRERLDQLLEKQR